MIKTIHNESGQVLLIVLLALAVITTVVLSIASRSTLDIVVSSKSEEAVRAFSAAEAGIERALITKSSVSDDFGETSSYDTQITAYPTASRDYIYPMELASGDSATIWFMSHDEDNNLVCDGSHPCFTGNEIKVCWGKANVSSITPAIEVSVLYEDARAPYPLKIARAAYDYSYSRRSSNSFSTASRNCTIAGQRFAYEKRFYLSSLGIPSQSRGTAGRLKLMRVKMLYNTDLPQTLGVASLGGSSSLPSQGRKVESVGTAGESTRKVEMFALFPELLPMLDVAIYSAEGLEK